MHPSTRAKLRLGLLWFLLPVVMVQHRLFFPLATALFPGFAHDSLTDQQWESLHRLYTAWSVGGLILLLGMLATAVYNLRKIKAAFPQPEQPYRMVRLLNVLLIVALCLVLLITLFVPRGAMLG